MTLHRLHHDGSCVLLDCSGPVPAVVHWGADVGPVLDGIEAATDRPRPPATLDVEPLRSLLPEAASGWTGVPGIECHRGDGPVFPRLVAAELDVGGDRCTFAATDEAAGVRVEGTVALGAAMTVEVTLVNTGPDPLHVQRLAPVLPLPDDADELLRFGGQWCGEFQPLRLPWAVGSHVVESRHGRTSHDSVPLVFAGPAGFGEQHGRVHGVHLAWSGSHQLRLDRLPDGRRTVQAAELLVAGEVVLVPGERYTAPAVVAASGEGLSEVSRRFHRYVRALRPGRSPRPVLLNTWEAVYFDHDRDTLFRLADRAASVGVERFVLDDGWFGGRRDDRAGLGDWWVSPAAHPEGLAPLIDHVTALGMDFGIWVEPEMVNPDSDLHRAHPDWVLGSADVTGRNQLVLDLSIEACAEHLLGCLDALLRDHDIAFVKWDMNRDLAGAGAHHQTLALYRMLDALRERHPRVEIESCASGGGRADLGILTRTDRIWTSDCNDALERQVIQRGCSHLFPPEVMGAHVGPPRAHTTGRVQRLSFRAATALFGHLGVEWDLLSASDAELDKLRGWISLHVALRPLLHGGDVVRLDYAEPTALAHGVVAPDGSEAVFALAQLQRPSQPVLPRLVLAGLDADRTYTVERLEGPGEVLGLASNRPAWLDGPVQLTGRALMTIGIQPPALLPESVLLIRLG